MLTLTGLCPVAASHMLAFRVRTTAAPVTSAMPTGDLRLVTLSHGLVTDVGEPVIAVMSIWAARGPKCLCRKNGLLACQLVKQKHVTPRGVHTKKELNRKESDRGKTYTPPIMCAGVSS